MPMFLRYSAIGERADVDAVDQNCTFRHVEKAADQIDQRAFAGAGGADQADHLAGLDLQIDAVNHLARAVFEADAAQFDLPFESGRDAPA